MNAAFTNTRKVVLQSGNKIMKECPLCDICRGYKSLKAIKWTNTFNKVTVFAIHAIYTGIKCLYKF